MLDCKQEPFIPEPEQEYLPEWVKKNFDILRIFIFEYIGTAMFAFGICICQMQPPPPPPTPNPNYINPSSNAFIPIALFFGICMSGRLTGGHLNPAVTLVFLLKKDSNVTLMNAPIYWLSQCAGALSGASLSKLFNSYYDTAPLIVPGSDVFVFKQFAGELIGTSLFTFFILLSTCPDTTLVKSDFLQWCLIAIFFYITRTFAYRPGGMNPALAIGMDIFYAIENNAWYIMKYIWILIVAPMAGACASSTLFQYLYRPWVVMLKRRQIKIA